MVAQITTAGCRLIPHGDMDIHPGQSPDNTPVKNYLPPEKFSPRTNPQNSLPLPRILPRGKLPPREKFFFRCQLSVTAHWLLVILIIYKIAY